MKIREGLSGVAIVLLVTATVWVAADRSLLRTSPEITAKIVLNSEDPNYRVKIVKPASGELRVKLVGSGRAIDKLMTEPARVTCRFSLSAADAEQAARAGQLVLHPRDGLARLAEEGITLEDCYPPEVVVKVDAVRRVSVKADLLPQDREQVDDGYAIEPAEVTATITSSSLERLGQRPWWAAPKLNLQSVRLQSGQADTQTADLVPSIAEGLDVVFDPPQVKVTQLRRTMFPARKTLTDKIRVWIEGPPTIFDQYDVEIEPQQISSLKVVGPQSEIDGLTADGVRAVLVLNSQDKPNAAAPIPRPLEIRFPGHERIQVDGEPPSVNFNLKPRKPSAIP